MLTDYWLSALQDQFCLPKSLIYITYITCVAYLGIIDRYLKICLISGLIGLISEPTELWEEAACKDIKFILEWWVEKKDSELAYAVGYVSITVD